MEWYLTVAQFVCPWWLKSWTPFHVPVGHSFTIFYEVSVQIFWPFKKWLSFYYWVLGAFCIFRIPVLSLTCFADIISCPVACLYVLLMMFLLINKDLILIKCRFFFFAFVSFTSPDEVMKIISYVSSRSFIALAFIFRSMVNHKLIFVNMI